MSIIQNLPSAIIGIISSCIAAYLSSNWAVKKFYKEKRWERKNEAYEEIINALYNLLQYCEIEKEDYGEDSGYPDVKRKEIAEAYNQGYWTIKKISTLKQYFYSNKVCSILDNLNNREKLEWNDNPSWEIYENEYIAYKKALDDIINEAKKDLKINSVFIFWRFIMIVEKIKNRSISADLNQCLIQNIHSYLQGAIYCWCKNCKTENNEPTWFSASALFGGDNYYWEGTPLYDLYKWHKDNKANDPVNMAGKDVGHLLRDVLKADKRIFNTKKEYTREYRWDGNS